MLPSSAGHCTCGNSHPVRQKGDISLTFVQHILHKMDDWIFRIHTATTKQSISLLLCKKRGTVVKELQARLIVGFTLMEV